MLVKDYMFTEVCTASPDQTIAEAIKKMVENNTNSLIVVDEDNKLYPGWSWINLAPAVSEWDKMDAQRMKNTYQFYREEASFRWGKYKMLMGDDSTFTSLIITKSLSWEMLYMARLGEWDRLKELLLFLKEYNPGNIIAEMFDYSTWSQGKSWIEDPGNQEQAAWYVLAIDKILNFV